MRVVAEEQGFEPWVRSHVRRFSRPVHSTTLPLLRRAFPIRCFLILKVTFRQICVLPKSPIHRKFRASRRGGRVVECTGLENRRAARYRGFESHPLCHKATPARGGGLMYFLQSPFHLVHTLLAFSYASSHRQR